MKFSFALNQQPSALAGRRGLLDENRIYYPHGKRMKFKHCHNRQLIKDRLSIHLVLKWRVLEINTKASCVDNIKDFNYFITIVILTMESCINHINGIVIYKMDMFLKCRSLEYILARL